MDSKEKDTNNLSHLRLFPHDLTSRISEMRRLEDKLSRLQDSPEKTYMHLALDLFNEGEIQQGLEFAKEALKLNVNIFNGIQINVGHCLDVTQLNEVCSIIPQAIFLLENPIDLEKRYSVAKWYGSFALSLFQKNEMLKALKMVDMALMYDPAVFDLEAMPFFYREYTIIVLEEEDDSSNNKKFGWIKNARIDHIYREDSFNRRYIICLDQKPTLEDPYKIYQALFDIEDFPKSHLLHIVAHCGFYHLLKWLLDSHIKVDHLHNGHLTPLMIASAYSNLSIVKLLLERGANAQHASPNGFVAFASDHDNDQFPKLKNLLLLSNDWGKYPCREMKPVHYASRYGHIEIVEYYLLERGIVVDEPTKYGVSPLMLACGSGKLAMVKRLLELKADITKKTNEDLNVLHFASVSGHLDIVEYLIEQGVAVDEPTEDGRTPLMMACRFGNLHLVKRLLELKADIAKKCNDGANVLHYALGNVHLDIVEYLLERGVAIDEQTLLDGQTPLMLACRSGNLHLVKRLLELKADITKKSYYGYNALHYALCKGHLNIVEYLLERGVAIDEPTEDGQTPLMIACRVGSLPIVDKLLAHEANITKKNKDGLNVLHIASWEGHLDIVEYLIEQGVAVDEPTEDGGTPLMMACRFGNLHLVKRLLAHKADTTRKDNYDRTAYDYALSSGHMNIAETIRQHDLAFASSTNDVGIKL